MNRLHPLATTGRPPERFANAARLFPVDRPVGRCRPGGGATDLEICRDNQAEAAARLTACTAVVADDKVTGRPKAFANWFIGDSLLKRDYDGALAVLNKALELDPDNATVLNSRGLAYFNRGDEGRALADYDLALQKRPNFPAPFNNRG